MEYKLYDSICMNKTNLQWEISNNGYSSVGNFKGAQGNFQGNGNVLNLVLVGGYMNEYYQNSMNCVIRIYAS